MRIPEVAKTGAGEVGLVLAHVPSLAGTTSPFEFTNGFVNQQPGGLAVVPWLQAQRRLTPLCRAELLVLFDLLLGLLLCAHRTALLILAVTLGLAE